MPGGHLTPTTWAWLDEQTADDVVRDPANRAYAILGGRTRQGWFLRADEVLASAVPPDLADVLRYARQSGCTFVTVDRDCIPLADLPVLHPEFRDANTSFWGSDTHSVPPASTSPGITRCWGRTPFTWRLPLALD